MTHKPKHPKPEEAAAAKSDVSAGTSHNERKQARKDAHKAQYFAHDPSVHSKHGKDGSSAQYAKDIASVYTAQEIAALLPDVPQKAPSAQFYPVYDPSICNIYVDELNVYRPGPPVRPCSSAPIGSLVRCMSSVPGGYTCSDSEDLNLKNCQVEPVGRHLFLPAATISIGANLHHYPARNYLVLTAINGSLARQFKSITLSAVLIKAIYSTSLQHPYVSVVDTLDHFVHATVLSMMPANSPLNLSIVGLTCLSDIISEPSDALTGVFRDSNQDQEKVFHTVAAPQADFAIRGDFRVIHCVRFDGTVVRDDLPTHVPKFSDAGIVSQLDGKFDTRGFSLWSGGTVFGPSPVVLDNALSRLFAPRDNEVYLRNQGFNLAREIWRNYTNCNYLEMGDVSVLAMGAGDMYDLDSRYKGTLKRAFWPHASNSKDDDEINPVFICPEVVDFGFSPEEKNNAISHAVKISKHRINMCSRKWWWVLADVVMTAAVRIYYSLLMSGMYTVWTYLSRIVTVQAPHAKRERYISYFNGHPTHPSGYMLPREIQVNLKTDELSKPKKHARIIGDLADGALVGRESISLAKILYNRPIAMLLANGTTVHEHHTLSKMSMAGLCVVFNALCDTTPGDRVVTVNSSDDGCAARVKGYEITIGNTDVKSNDSGQPISSFIVVYLQCCHFCIHTALAIMQMCLLPMIVKCIVKQPKSPPLVAKFKLQFNGFQQTSGHNATTNINDAGNANCLACTASLLSDTDASMARCVEAGFGFAGHSATFQLAENYAEIQFLKYSPFIAQDLSYKPWGNMGKIIKKLGSCNSDLTAEMTGLTQLEFTATPKERRWELFAASVIEGYKHEPHNPLLDALRLRFPPTSNTKPIPILYQIDKDSLESVSNATDDLSSEDASAAFFLRYKINSDELEELLLSVKELRLGRHYSLVACRKIMAIDYGFSYDDV